MADVRPTAFVLDNDLDTRSSLSRLIESRGWASRLFGSAREFFGSPPAHGPSCLILDTVLPDTSGLDVQEFVIRERTEVPIIFIAGDGDLMTGVRAMKGGAIEFLTKPYSDEVVIKAISAALDRSETMLSEKAAIDALRARYDSLSRRERQVMDLVVSGLLNKQVGGELGISEITVKAHRGRVMDKMRARSLADLVRMSTPLHPRRWADVPTSLRLTLSITTNSPCRCSDVADAQEQA